MPADAEVIDAKGLYMECPFMNLGGSLMTLNNGVRNVMTHTGYGLCHAIRMATLTPVFDKELENGEIFQLGSMKIRCVLTPGHSAGVMSFFFEVTDSGNTHLAGMFGGAGLGVLTLSQIQYCKFPLEQPQIMPHSIERIQNEPVSV